MNYVKIPREIIYNKDLSSKRVIIFSYLCVRRSLDDTVAFSTTELCHWSKLKPNYRDGKINQKYYEVLLLLSHYGYFESCPDFEKCLKENTNSVKYQQVQLNIEKFDVPDNWGIIYFDELDKILNFKEELKGKDKDIDLTRMSSAYILLLLSYIRVNLNRMEKRQMLPLNILWNLTQKLLMVMLMQCLSLTKSDVLQWNQFYFLEELSNDTNVGSLEEVHKIVTDNADKYPNGKWELYPMQLAV